MTDFAPMAFDLETERLILRPWQLADAVWYRQLLAERDSALRTPDRVRDLLAAMQQKAAASGISILPIVRKSGGDPIGTCGLISGRSPLAEPEIAYELLRRAHGCGYATEAATAVVGAATATGRRRIWATVRPWNAASFRVLEKLGFERRHSTWDEKGELVWSTRQLPGLLNPS